MSKTKLIGSVEITINKALKQISILKGRDQQSLHNEFKEWIDAINSDEKTYDILFINKISKNETQE